MPIEHRQHRHVIILDVPDDGTPARGDLEMVYLWDSDATTEEVLTLSRPMKYPDEENSDDQEKMIPDGGWSRDEGIYGPQDPKEAFDKNTSMIEALEETLRFLKAERPGLLARATAWLVDPKNPEFWQHEAKTQREKIERAIHPKITDLIG